MVLWMLGGIESDGCKVLKGAVRLINSNKGVVSLSMPMWASAPKVVGWPS